MADLIRVPVRASSGRYEVLIGPGALRSHEALGTADGVVLISHPKLIGWYGHAFRNFQPTLLTLPPGERSKSLASASSLLRLLARSGFRRGGTIVALGGGVIGDVAGFIASVYHRGVRIVQAPTTLLAQVDASVGGKVGVDLPEGKNLVGAFLQPTTVLTDTDTLRTLPIRHVRNGMAEVIKYGFLCRPRLIDTITRNQSSILARDLDFLPQVVAECVRIKAKMISEDEFDKTGVRARLNLGHTVGHAIETALGYRSLLHGEAISIGMVAEAKIAERLKLCPKGLSEEYALVLRAFSLPTSLPVECEPKALVALVYRDKKAARGKLAMSLPRDMGRVELIEDLEPKPVLHVLEEMRRDG